MIIADKKITSQRKSNLENMYKRYYSEANGSCKYFHACSKTAFKKHFDAGYDSSYAALVGDNYDLTVNGQDIRILFIGKEAINKVDKLYPPNRLLDFDTDKHKHKVNLHYIETYRMLCRLLNYNWENGSYQDGEKYLYKPDASLTCFALSNIYRCAFKKYPGQVKSIPNYPEQTENCLKILHEEIKILEPTIIVIQKAGFKATLLDSDALPCEGFDKLFYSEKLTSHIIETIHPSNYGKWHNIDYPLFSAAAEYLRAKGLLPDFSTTNELNELIQ